jgi:hypothetical protein
LGAVKSAEIQKLLQLPAEERIELAKVLPPFSAFQHLLSR